MHRAISKASMRWALLVLLRWAALLLVWPTSSITAFDFYAPFLPDQIAANETITHIELRLYLNASERSDGAQIRITPSSPVIDFSPAAVVFNSSSAVAQTLSLRARDEGVASISFYAAIKLGDEEWIQNDTLVTTQSLSVLPPPLSYAIDDARWNGVVLLNDSFEDTASSFSVATSPLWGKIRHGYPSTACGASDGEQALYFTALGDRFAMTKPLSLVGFDGKIHFRHVYGFRSTGQDYDSVGDNRVSCEHVDTDEEVVVSYLPADQDEANTSAWQVLSEIARPAETPNGSAFHAYTVSLPAGAMHGAARFRWQQKNHSSFPVDPVPGLSLPAIISGSNDDTSLFGDLGVNERELWKYRNLFDQWALDDVRLEVRLNPPIFSQDSNVATYMLSDGTNVSVAVGYADVLVDSPVHDTWVEFAVGDGTHAYPTCHPSNAAQRDTAQTVRLNASGYVHAIACLDVYGDATAIVSSFPTRSKRVLVQARAPVLSTSMDATTHVDTWTISMSCDGCAFMRYTTSTTPVFVTLDTGDEEELSDEKIARASPSCSYGTLVEGTTGSVQVNSNNRVFVVACGASLLPSEVVYTSLLAVSPRAPTFEYSPTETTVTNEFNVTIVPPGDESGLGVAYVVSSSSRLACPSPDSVVLGPATVTVKASDVIRAVSCCVAVQCVDSVVATWGPIEVKSVQPVFSMACSDVHPLTMELRVSAVTSNAWIQYRVGQATTPSLDCTETPATPFISSGETIEIASVSTRVEIVSCLAGLKPSASVAIDVAVEDCCAGIASYLSPSCAHVLLFQDDFSSSCLDATKWTALTTQWGGQDVNGGIHAANAQCTVDASRSDKRVLQLHAHGDVFSGTTPVGHKRVDDSLIERSVQDRYVEWALDGVSPLPCNQLERCPARRVGAAVQIKGVEENAGVMVVRLQPCEAFGTLTQIWWGDYTMKESEAQQAIPFLPLWKAGMYQARTAPHVSFVGTSPSLSSSTFMEIAMQWNATLGRANLYVDGQLVQKQVLDEDDTTDANGALSLGVWFPNAVAGEPLFATCHVLVDDVRVFKAEVAGNRWCDFESVQQDVVPCASDADCHDWVLHHCFMPIHEAVCSKHQRENTTEVEVETVDGEDEERDVDTAETAAASVTQSFCHFRMQPLIREDVSSTDMTERASALEWHEEEEA